MFHSNKYMLSFYSKSPEWIQNLLFTIHGMIKSIQNKKVNKIISKGNYFSNLSKDEIEREQLGFIKKLLKHSYATVPFYRSSFNEIGINVDDINSFSDFEKIPIIVKEDLLNHQEDFISKNAESFYPHLKSTGSTTGTPLNYTVDYHYYSVLEEIQYLRFLQSHNFHVGKDRHVVLRGTVLIPQGRPMVRPWREDSFRNILYFSSFYLSEEVMKSYYQKIQDWKPKFIRAYPSAIYHFAKYLNKRNLKYPLKGIFTSSESVYDYHRDEIQSAFGCKIYDHYGHGEPGCYAAGQCSLGNYHIPSSDVFVEVSSEGHIIETVLTSYSMPFIRYKIGDLVDGIHYGCDCGNNQPFFKKIYGRENDVILTPSGRAIGTAALSLWVEGTNIVKSQIIQNRTSEIIVRVVPNDHFSDYNRQIIKDNLMLRIGTDVKINIEEVKEIPLTKSGKYRYIISNLKR